MTVRRVTVLLVLAALAPAAPATAAAAPPQCFGGTVVMTPNQPKTLDFPNCDGAGDNPVVTVVTPPTIGTVTGNPFVYTPPLAFVGVTSFLYTAENTTTGETSAEATVNLVVDTPPTCGDGTATTIVGQPLRIAFSAFPCSDADGSGNLLIHTSDAANGTVVSDFGRREVVYTPEPGFAGVDEFSFYASDDITHTPTRTMRVTVGQGAQPTPTPAPTPTPITSVIPPPPPAAVDRAAPKARAKVVSASIAKGVSLRLASNEAGRAKLTLSVDRATARKLRLKRRPKLAVTIGTGTARLVNGSVKSTVKLSPKARKALKHVRRLKARLTVVVTDAAGNSRTTTLTVVLKR
jgi:hypothetical protein